VCFVAIFQCRGGEKFKKHPISPPHGRVLRCFPAKNYIQLIKVAVKRAKNLNFYRQNVKD
jgi:hypothetical protein